MEWIGVDTLLYLLTGAFAGFAAGLLGIGGGLIIVPVLYFVFSAQSFPPQHVMHMALATSLATIIFTSISSTLAHHKKQAVLWPLVWLLAPGIVIGAWLGGSAAARLDTSVLKPVFAVFELLVAIQLLRQSGVSRRQTRLASFHGLAGGTVIGFVSAIVGIGGGTLTVPFLHWHNVSMRNAVATSAACGLPIAAFATGSYIFAGSDAGGLPEPSWGYVFLPAFGSIVIASFVFAPLGAKVAHWLPENTLRTGFGLFLLALGAYLITG